VFLKRIGKSRKRQGVEPLKRWSVEAHISEWSKKAKNFTISLPFLYREGEGWLDWVGFGWTVFALSFGTASWAGLSWTCRVRSTIEGKLVWSKVSSAQLVDLPLDIAGEGLNFIVRIGL
jgi:hypothetical protein